MSKRGRLRIASALLIALVTLIASCSASQTMEASPDPAREAHQPGEAAPTTAADASGPTALPTAEDANPNEVEDPASSTACDQEVGQVQRVEYSSQLLGEYIPVLVYLPPCYSPEREYPTIYLLHGKPQDENHWLILGVKQTVDQAIAAEEMSAVVLVMPEQPEPLFSQTDGGPGSYEGEFLSALMPYIEGHYAVSGHPDQRAIAGVSRGGVWALEIAFRRSELFSGVAALSPALNVNDAREEYDPLLLANRAELLPEHIFLASGDLDSAAEGTASLHNTLVQRGRAHRYTKVPGGHEGGTWQQLVGEMLDYLTQDW